MLNYRRLSRSQDTVVSSAWLNYLDLGRSFEWSEKMDQDLQKLNAQQVNAVLRKYLKPKEMVVAIAADHERQKQGAAAPEAQEAEQGQAPVPAPTAPAALEAQP